MSAASTREARQQDHLTGPTPTVTNARKEGFDFRGKEPRGPVLSHASSSKRYDCIGGHRMKSLLPTTFLMNAFDNLFASVFHVEPGIFDL